MAEIDVFKELPGYTAILRAVLKNQIQFLVSTVAMVLNYTHKNICFFFSMSALLSTFLGFALVILAVYGCQWTRSTSDISYLVCDWLGPTGRQHRSKGHSINGEIEWYFVNPTL